MLLTNKLRNHQAHKPGQSDGLADIRQVLIASLGSGKVLKTSSLHGLKMHNKTSNNRACLQFELQLQFNSLSQIKPIGCTIFTFPRAKQYYNCALLKYLNSPGKIIRISAKFLSYGQSLSFLLNLFFPLCECCQHCQCLTFIQLPRCSG